MQGHDHQFEYFFGELSSSNHYLQIGTSWSHRGRPVIHKNSDLERYVCDLVLKLLPQGSLSPIYILGEFQAIWSRISTGTSCIGVSSIHEGTTPLGEPSVGGLNLDVGPETSRGGSHYPDLSLGRV